ncbi:LemA family protein [Thioalkalivibrio sp. XN279]|uniref:LemA family protein n=1 Tax=Thioalkalivibrio sp. XN279 TaxID=2714953 RepID=UPI00140CBB0B|nr:LemA family protein [Thioalkalivibrio sp. XN279]NHA14930.1 LemA family protein [Thioalkalivibrio sp. XN279]
MGLWIVLIIIAAVVLWAIGIYNKLVNLRNAVKNAFAQIDVQLTRRYDLIPNLVEAVKGYMKHERETLEAVISARTRAVQSLKSASEHPESAAAIQELSSADAGLSAALGRLFALSEAYPDLKADRNMMQFQEELTSTENKVAFARQAFNDAVMRYNNARENFPNNLVANSFSFDAAAFLEIESEEKRAVPQVSF